MRASAELGSGAQDSGDIADCLGVKVQSIPIVGSVSPASLGGVASIQKPQSFRNYINDEENE